MYPAGPSPDTEIVDFIGGGRELGDFIGSFPSNPLVVDAVKTNLELVRDGDEDGYREFYERGQLLCDVIEEAARNAFVPELAGYTHVYCYDCETDLETWRDWHDVEHHGHFDGW